MRFLILALAVLMTQAAAAAEAPLRIDVLLPLTGAAAFFGNSEAQALHVYRVVPTPRSYLFAASATLEANNISKLAAIRALGYKRMAVLTETDETGKHNLAYTNEFFASPAGRGVELVSSVAYKPEDGDIAAQVAAMRSANPDSVVVWASGAAFGVALRGLASGGLNVPVFTSQTDASPVRVGPRADRRIGAARAAARRDRGAVARLLARAPRLRRPQRGLRLPLGQPARPHRYVGVSASALGRATPNLDSIRDRPVREKSQCPYSGKG